MTDKYLHIHFVAFRATANDINIIIIKKMSSAIKQVSRKSDLYCIQLQYEQPVYMSMLLITTDNSAPYPSICTNKQEAVSQYIHVQLKNSR